MLRKGPLEAGGCPFSGASERGPRTLTVHAPRTWAVDEELVLEAIAAEVARLHYGSHDGPRAGLAGPSGMRSGTVSGPP